MFKDLYPKYTMLLVSLSIFMPFISLETLAISDPEEEIPTISNNDTEFQETELNKSGQSLKEFDTSKFSKLEKLDISNNQLTHLDVSTNQNLKSLNCSNNQLEELKFGDGLLFSSLNCANNCLPALDLTSCLSLTSENCDFSNQKIVLPKNLTTLNLKDKFPIIESNRVKDVSSKGNEIIYDPNTSNLSGIKPEMEVTYIYKTNNNEEENPGFNMEVTLSFTGEEDSTIQKPDSDTNLDPLPPFNPGSSSNTKPDVEDSGIPMHRLYNPNTGEHHYTSDTNERDTLVKVGWNSEGIGWIAPEKVGQPVYRLYNPITEGGDHHYTLDIKERDALRLLGWRYEDVGWLSADKKNGIPLYREYNPNQYSANHNYTLDKNEHDTLIQLGWNDEGLAWYGLKKDT